MRSVLLMGAGKIGRMIAKFLAECGEFQIRVADSSQQALDRLTEQTDVQTLQLDAEIPDQLAAALEGADAVISALSYHFNPGIAEAALKAGISYFDLTEDVETTRRVRALAENAVKGQIFMPQCGLAPGFVSVVAHQLAGQFDKLDVVRMRVGALPQFPANAMKYNLTWSTDGLINEYCNVCEAIHGGRRIEVLPLEGLEHFSLDGVRYEAFNTSGGLGTLCETLEGQVRELNYKTIRYLGHRELTAFLVHELGLGQRREVLKDILETAVPITFQDVVVVFCTVTGQRNGQFVQISNARKIYHDDIDGESWSAIQITTAAGLCTMIDLWAEGALPNEGFVRQEQVGLDAFLDNRFGRYYRTRAATRFSSGAEGPEDDDE